MDSLSEGLIGKLPYMGWEHRLELPESLGSGYIVRMMIRPGLEVLVENMDLRENLKLHIEQNCQVLGLTYHLSGQFYCEWNGASIPTSNSPGNTVFFTDSTRVYLETSSQSKSYGIKVRLSPQVLAHYLGEPNDQNRFETIMSQYKNKIKPSILTAAVEKIVHDILVCGYTGALKRLYMESKALELIMLFLELEEDSFRPASSAPSRNDLEKLYLARQIIINHLEHPLSILELSKSVGLSTTKLKKGFRELFGLTIFDLVREQRLLKGAWLLETNQMKVCEAAVTVGYSNPSNFASAFRKQYGCNPSEYIQQSRLINN